MSAAAMPPVGAKVDRVRVFSQYARVYRKSWVRLTQADTETRFALVDLPEAARRSSLRVQSKSQGARVVRVETHRVRPMLPRQKKTEALIKRLEALLSQQRALDDRRALMQKQLSFVDGLGVADIDSLAQRRRLTGPVGLHVRAWQRILDWTGTRAATLRKDLLALSEKRRLLRRELHKLRVEGKELQREVLRKTALRVFVTLRGAVGKHGLELSYLVSDSRWMPSYDLRYLPKARAVKATYYAMVKQETGEDWKSARLRFSTGRALQLLAIPELKTWTIGRKRDFHPRPRPRLEPSARRWRAPPPPPPPDLLLQQLQRLAGKPTPPVVHLPRGRHRFHRGSLGGRPHVSYSERYYDLQRRHDQRRGTARYLANITRQVVALERAAYRARDIVRLNCVRSKRRTLRAFGNMLRRWPRRARIRYIIVRRAGRLLVEARNCVGADAAYLGRTKSLAKKRDTAKDGLLDSDDDEDRGEAKEKKKVEEAKSQPEPVSTPRASAPPPPAPPAKASYAPRAQRSVSRVQVLADAPATGGASFGVRFSRRRKPRESVPWTDTGYRPTPLHRDLPAAAAKGYRYTLYAPGTHDVSASGKERRIPILEQQLAVRPLHRIVPGRSKLAYLVGTLTNSTGRPILRGHANLFAAAASNRFMFTGRTWINTSLPGAKLELPLGVDDGVKVSRYTKQKTVIKGLIFKDDVTRYTVTIEVANHHGYAIEAQVVDQVPLVLPRARKVEVKRFDSASGFSKPDADGRVRWRGRVAPQSKVTLTFTFDLVRPKDWRMRQHGG
ncbi:MAG: mucoidy inhibitor MuiA family protein [Myxococcales bacterium]|nr:mucoidy inhibitor MuiA family protein [Myxococcales bacterium]